MVPKNHSVVSPTTTTSQMCISLYHVRQKTCTVLFLQ